MSNKVIATAFVVFVFASSGMAMQQAVSWCAKTFLDCALAIANDSYAGDNLTSCQLDYQNCSVSTPAVPPKSKECFLAEDGWQSVKVIAGLTAGAFIGAVFILPHGVAIYAHFVNRAAAADDVEHPYISALGKWLVKVRDVDGDGKVTGHELLKPQVAYGVIGVGYLSSVIAKAYEWQALCDFTASGGRIEGVYQP